MSLILISCNSIALSIRLWTREEYFTSTAYSCRSPLSSRSSPQKLARESRGRSSRRWNRFCVHARVHASALSLIVHRIGVSAFQNSNARSAQVGFLVLDIAATAIVRYRPTHLHLLSKRLRTNGDYIIHVSLLRPANASSSLLRSSRRRQRLLGA